MSGHVRALLAEVAGTFLFFFIGAGAIVATGGENLVAIALAHGLALSVAVSSFGGLSGGHFNPAVTFGLAIAGKHPWPRVATYWVAQGLGGLVAGFALRYAFEFDPSALSRTHIGTPGLGGGVTVTAGIAVEAILTIFVLWAVFGTAVSPLAPRIGGFGIGLMVAGIPPAGSPPPCPLGSTTTGTSISSGRWPAPRSPRSRIASCSHRRPISLPPGRLRPNRRSGS
ncbi:MAG: aquaporin [Chloroflexi bacterium]|nr:MAG: aquaporin [Chloroflexota bacterium]